MMTPLFSASPMNTPGEIAPRVGCRQRASASNPVISHSIEAWG